MSGSFNPSLGTFGTYPQQGPNIITLYAGWAGNEVGYFLGAMKFCFAQGNYVAPNWGPWRMLSQAMSCMANLHSFWYNVPGIPAEQAAQCIGPASWGVIQYVVHLNGYQ